ncbi:hypothetical protein [Burkholderia pyrrocinia]|uniref:hypothetical protein n=1 Tax=Burkholderia pyrrocinia TaxID=60550 RepID=UPI00064BD19B|nr:hypothetical protein [Burkholderia pyrrocinia]AKM00417.1 hypothetical protein ABD05_09510 [Burkholderia pyrrocinia]
MRQAILAILVSVALPLPNATAQIIRSNAAPQMQRELGETFQFQQKGSGSIPRALSVKLADTINAADFGMQCNGTADDTNALNRALSYAATVAPSVVNLPLSSSRCVITGTINVPGNVTLAGSRGQRASLSAGMPNLNPLISLDGDGSAVRDLYIDATASGPNFKGAAIAVKNVVAPVISGIYIQGPFIGIDLNGNQALIDQTIINGIKGSGSIGIRIGARTIHGNTVDARITHTTVIADRTDPGDIAMQVLDAGGLLVSESDMLFTKIGTQIIPGSQQWVAWASFSNTYVGDTNAIHALAIDTTAPTARVEGLECTACWTASAQSDNIVVDNSAKGIVSEIHFNGLRNYNGASNGANIHAGTFVTFDASRFCGNGRGGGPAANIVYGANVGAFAVRNSELGGRCGGLFATAPEYGLFLTGNNTGALISGNDFSGSKVPISGTPAGNSVMASNLGIDNSPATIESAATIDVHAASIAMLTGQATIRSIRPTWNGRILKLIPSHGPASFATGGNLCNTVTMQANVPVDAYFNGACWNLK